MEFVEKAKIMLERWIDHSDHHQEEFDPNNLLLALVRLADKACCKLGIGLDEEPSLVLAATSEAEILHTSEVDLARMEIMLEDSQVFETGR